MQRDSDDSRHSDLGLVKRCSAGRDCAALNGPLTPARSSEPFHGMETSGTIFPLKTVPLPH